MADKNINKDVDKDLNLDFVDEDLRDVGIFFIFARYIFPFIAGLIVFLLFIGLAWLLLRNANIDFDQMAPIGGAIIILVLILVISSRKG